jgi:K(+)-stimulated pyrophosphate-energized sodium pump
MQSLMTVFALWLQPGAVEDPEAGSFYLAMVIAVSLVSLGVAFLFARSVMGKDAGTAEMQKISNAIRKGAEAFLRRQYSTIVSLAVALAIIIYLGYAFGKGDSKLALRMTISFVVGAACSLAAGFCGMWVSIRSNIRVASAARKDLNEALKIALRGGAVTGLGVVALSLLGVGGLFWLFDGLGNPKLIPFQIVAFGFGASFVALFAQLGGGIYTKAADVGADLVGKVEAGIPEDDPRNPAVIADLVGDNVGDCAGRGADLFESTAAENIGAMILGVALYPIYGVKGIMFPLVARAFGLIASIVGVLIVRVKANEDPMKALNRGYYVTTVLAMAGFYAAVHFLLQGNLMLFSAGIVGIVTAFLFVWITQYYTEYKYRPVRSIAESAKTGAATVIITGMSVALECTALPVVVISGAILGSYYLGVNAGLPGIDPIAAGFYGTAIATMGMLSTCAYILAMDTFGPITDNAGGIIEMSQQPE